MKICSVVNVKGGVGKTTSVINIAGELAKQGNKVLIIDNDPQSNVTQILDKEGAEVTLYNVYDNSKVDFKDAMLKVKDNLYLVSNKIESSNLEVELASRMGRESILKHKTIPLGFDWVLIDCSPFLGVLTQNALAMSDYYIAVVDNSTSSLTGLDMLEKVISDIKKHHINSKIKMLGVLRNRFDKNTKFSKSFNEVLIDVFEDQLFETIVYNSIKYKEAVAYNELIQDYSKVQAEPYTKIVNEMLERTK